jgi:TolA-binding protein
MQDFEIEREIREIKREIIESRGLVIKTNNLTSTLGSDLKSIAKRQAGYERKLTINSAFAYVLTVAVIFVGAYAFSDQSARRLESQLQAVEQQKQGLQNELESKNKLKASREEALRATSKLVDYVNRGERQMLLEEVTKINRDELSPIETKFLDDAAAQFKSELSMASFAEGLEHLNQQRYDEAVTALESSLGYVKEGIHVGRVRLYLSKALRLQGKQPEAVSVLLQLLDSDLIDRELAAEARWSLATCYIEMHKRDEAQRELRYIINKFPTSQWARQARPKLLDVNRM